MILNRATRQQTARRKSTGHDFERCPARHTRDWLADWMQPEA